MWHYFGRHTVISLLVFAVRHYGLELSSFQPVTIDKVWRLQITVFIPSKSSLLDILPCTVLKSCTHVQLGGLGSTVSNPNRVHGPIPSLRLEYWPLWRNGTHPLWDLQGYDSGLQWLQQVWVVCEACRLSIEIRVSADHLNPSCRCSSISYQTYLTSMCRFTASLL